MRRNIHPLVIAALAWLLESVSGRALTERTRFEQCVFAVVGVLALALIPEIFFAWRNHWTEKYGETPPHVFQIAVAVTVTCFELGAATNLLSYGNELPGWPFVLGGIAPFAYPAVRLVGAARKLSTIMDADRLRLATRQLLVDLICCGSLAIALSWVFLGHTDQRISDGLVGIPIALFGLVAFIEGCAGLLNRRPVALVRPLPDATRVLGAFLTAAIAVSTVFLILISPANGLPYPIPVVGGVVGIAYAAARLGRRHIRSHKDGKALG